MYICVYKFFQKKLSILKSGVFRVESDVHRVDLAYMPV